MKTVTIVFLVVMAIHANATANSKSCSCKEVKKGHQEYHECEFKVEQKNMSCAQCTFAAAGMATCLCHTDVCKEANSASHNHNHGSHNPKPKGKERFNCYCDKEKNGFDCHIYENSTHHPPACKKCHHKKGNSTCSSETKCEECKENVCLI